MQQPICTVFFLLLLIPPMTLAFHTQQTIISSSSRRSISSRDALSTTTSLFDNPAAKEEDTASSDQQNSDNNGDLFLSQMASNIRRKVEEAHPTTATMSSSSSNNNNNNRINMVELDTKAKMKQWAGNYDKDAMRAKLQDRIANNAVFLLMYGTCPYCAKVIDALKSYCAASDIIQRQRMLFVDLDALGVEKYSLRTEVMELVEHNTIPALWMGGQFIGGLSEVEALQTSPNDNGKDRFQILLEEAMAKS